VHSLALGAQPSSSAPRVRRGAPARVGQRLQRKAHARRPRWPPVLVGDADAQQRRGDALKGVAARQQLPQQDAVLKGGVRAGEEWDDE
jgi:hypothetical protein